MFYSKKSRSFFSRFGSTSIVVIYVFCVFANNTETSEAYSSAKCGTSKCGT